MRRGDDGAEPSIVLRQLATLCEERGWNYSEVGRRMGRSPEWWRGIVTGAQENITLQDVESLAKLLGTRVELRPSGHPVESVEAALASDPDLYEHSRRVVLAAYRTARTKSA
jgi:transcriptional regulator with XRE-family HTH domain